MPPPISGFRLLARFLLWLPPRCQVDDCSLKRARASRKKRGVCVWGGGHGSIGEREGFVTKPADDFCLFTARGVTIKEQFQRKKPNRDGSPSDVFIINEEFMAMIDWFVASYLWASVTDARGLHEYYMQRVALYKHFNGADGRRNWREELVAVLESWMERFPATTRSVNSSFADMSPGDIITEVEQVSAALPACML